MASIITEKGGTRRIDFIRDDKRQSLRLGKASKRDAQGVKLHVERLLNAALTGMPVEGETALWLRDRPDAMYERLAAVGLVPERAGCKLGAFVDAYIEERKHLLRPNTVRHLGESRRELLAYFGADRDMRAITAGDAQQFFLWLQSADRVGGPKHRGALGINTAKRFVGRAKQFLTFAVLKGLITVNPFGAIKCRVGNSGDRLQFVKAADVEKVLATITDPEFKAAVVLARWGGLRVPSELVPLKWADVDFEAKRLTVHVPKLHHLEGKDRRVVPLFPEIEKALLDLFGKAQEGQERVFTRMTGAVNLRQQMLRHIKRAGVEAWPKLWQNLRGSRDTELREAFPETAVDQWVGHSAAVAKAHYLTLLEQSFERATNWSTSIPQQKPQQSASVSVETPKCRSGGSKQNRREIPSDSDGHRTVSEPKLPPVGVEHPAKTSGKSAPAAAPAAESAAPAIGDQAALLAALPALLKSLTASMTPAQKMAVLRAAGFRTEAERDADE